MKQFFLRHIYFSRTERMGSWVLLLLCILAYLLPSGINRWWPTRSTDFSVFQSEIRHFRESAPLRQSTGQRPGVVRPFHFDPNTASPEQLMRLGLSERTARSICHYREKGGQFRKPSDLKKIYTLKPADFDRLEPFIQIGQAEKKPEPVSETIAVVKEDKPEPQYHAEPEKRNYSTKKVRTDLKIDINRALEAEWRQLPGLGEKRAAQIVRFRSALGGFISVDQVSELYGLPDSIFLRIRPMLELTSGGIKSLNLNTATEEELKKHPYISFRQAKLILSYREQHGSFHAVDDLQKIAAFTDKKWLDKIKPYLSVE